MAPIWDKIGRAVKKGVTVAGNIAALVPKALLYPVKKPFASLDRMKHDAKVSLKEAVGMNVPEEERKYDPPIETTKASENFGVQIKEQKEKGKVTFLVSRTLTGDIPYLNDEQLDTIKKDLPSVTVFREENKVVIEVDVEKITNDIKNDPKNKGKSPGEIKKLVLQEIYNEVDRNFKGLAKITGGEFKIHTDRKLLHGIAEKLYKEYDGQNKSAEEFNMTNPNQFPFKETISPIKSRQLLQDIKEQAGGLESVCSLKDVSPGDKVESPLASPIGDEKGERKSR
ncbi:hypothetical protein [Wolbachia endosymbiont of Ctenocephalides felis wCfeJ]|uniref:hypothetical protein n=1 Tax=Wolbachia endosymbiont of Ctenocephalides felis wCfeJ TaxID=2732594 RepID=UPI001445EB8F|nr:hypothetical protein [Wolbachia endosymbiont of Ctenocephalides felis wCfeJ]WCR57655.1 MAG: hypothetical protein PG980_000127 [Wolbachia endosymbiont of Ctenocephalides felis wCfeJ]